MKDNEELKWSSLASSDFNPLDGWITKLAPDSLKLLDEEIIKHVDSNGNLNLTNMKYEDVMNLIEWGFITLSPYEVKSIEKLVRSENPLYGKRIQMSKQIVLIMGDEL